MLSTSSLFIAVLWFQTLSFVKQTTLNTVIFELKITTMVVPDWPCIYNNQLPFPSIYAINGLKSEFVGTEVCARSLCEAMLPLLFNKVAPAFALLIKILPVDISKPTRLVIIYNLFGYGWIVLNVPSFCNGSVMVLVVIF